MFETPKAKKNILAHSRLAPNRTLLFPLDKRDRIIMIAKSTTNSIRGENQETAHTKQITLHRQTGSSFILTRLMQFLVGGNGEGVFWQSLNERLFLKKHQNIPS